MATLKERMATLEERVGNLIKTFDQHIINDHAHLAYRRSTKKGMAVKGAGWGGAIAGIAVLVEVLSRWV